MSPFMRFVDCFVIVFSLMLCATFYIMNNMQLGGSPTQVVMEAAPEPREAEPKPLNPIASGKPSSTPSVTPQVQTPDVQLYTDIFSASEANADTVGWITIPGTNINYPVVQAADNDYYLRRGYDRRYKFAGSIFADFRNKGTTRQDISPNTVLYGHNINLNHNKVSGEMFAQLMKYKDLEFAQQSQYIYYSTKEDQMVWEIFAAFYTDVEFYYIDVEMEDPAYHQHLLDEAKARSEYIYDVEVTTEDKILTLSTCTYKYKTNAEQRFVVMARLVPDNNDSKQRTVIQNPNPKPPSFMTGA